VDVWIVVEQIVNDQGSNNTIKVQHPKNLSKPFWGFNPNPLVYGPENGGRKL
jgi:hypothetical protein